MKRAVLQAVTLVGAAAIMMACERRTVRIAFEDTCGRGDAGAPCPPGMFCDTQSCEDSATGTCQPTLPPACPEQYQPECGCDGITYFNPCLRRQHGTGLLTAGSCTSLPLSCNVEGAPCADGGTCIPSLATPRPPRDDEMAFWASLPEGGVNFCEDVSLTRLVPFFFGTCWVLPATCGPESGRVYSACGQGCFSACSAIQGGGVFYECPTAPPAE